MDVVTAPDAAVFALIAIVDRFHSLFLSLFWKEMDVMLRKQEANGLNGNDSADVRMFQSPSPIQNRHDCQSLSLKQTLEFQLESQIY